MVENVNQYGSYDSSRRPNQRPGQVLARAGYSASTAREQGSRLLTNVHVADAVAKGRDIVIEGRARVGEGDDGG
jgi:hypothetical protein